MNDADFMAEALKEAEGAAAAGEVPIGAVAVKDGIIVARARNQVEELHTVSAHAEFQLLHKIEALSGDWRMSDYTFYVTKEPCFMCSGMIINARFKRIAFGLPDHKTGGCGGSIDIPSHPDNLWHPEITGGILAEESKTLIQTFFRQRRKEQTK